MYTIEHVVSPTHGNRAQWVPDGVFNFLYWLLMSAYFMQLSESACNWKLHDGVWRSTGFFVSVQCSLIAFLLFFSLLIKLDFDLVTPIIGHDMMMAVLFSCTCHVHLSFYFFLFWCSWIACASFLLGPVDVQCGYAWNIKTRIYWVARLTPCRVWYLRHSL